MHFFVHSEGIWHVILVGIDQVPEFLNGNLVIKINISSIEGCPCCHDFSEGFLVDHSCLCLLSQCVHVIDCGALQHSHEELLGLLIQVAHFLLEDRSDGLHVSHERVM
jgi:hypothetical protein